MAGVGKKKAVGSRGSWFADVDGELLPCVHKHWWASGGLYDDPGLRPGMPKGDELVVAIRAAKRVVLTSDTATFGGAGEVVGFERTGYIAVYEVDAIEYDEAGLRFKFVKRLDHLK